MFAALERTADALIAANRNPFDVVRGHLYATGRLTSAEARRMLARVVRMPMPEGGDQRADRLVRGAVLTGAGGPI